MDGHYKELLLTTTLALQIPSLNRPATLVIQSMGVIDHSGKGKGVYQPLTVILSDGDSALPRGAAIDSLLGKFASMVWPHWTSATGDKLMSLLIHCTEGSSRMCPPVLDPEQAS